MKYECATGTRGKEGFRRLERMASKSLRLGIIEWRRKELRRAGGGGDWDSDGPILIFEDRICWMRIKVRKKKIFL